MTAANERNLPAPLTPADCDLQDFKFMPLDVARLRDSDMASEQTPEENWAAVLLWAAAWHQVPAASMPDSDNWIAKAAGYMSRGRIDEQWATVKEGAMRGFILCSDGRWYHQVVAEKANESWVGKLKQRLKTECGRIKKHNDRHGTKIPFPEFDAWYAAGCPTGQKLPVPGDSDAAQQGQKSDQTGAQAGEPIGVVPDHADPAAKTGEIDMSQGTEAVVSGDITPLSHGTSGDVPRESASKRQGEGQGELTNTPIPPGGGSSSPKTRATAIALQTFLDECAAKGERPLRDYTPLWEYAKAAGLSLDLVALAWIEFRRRFGPGGTKEARRQKNWRQTFRNYVENNYLKLWFVDGNGEYVLTTQGQQARKTYESKEPT